MNFDKLAVQLMHAANNFVKTPKKENATFPRRSDRTYYEEALRKGRGVSEKIPGTKTTFSVTQQTDSLAACYSVEEKHQKTMKEKLAEKEANRVYEHALKKGRTGDVNSHRNFWRA